MNGLKSDTRLRRSGHLTLSLRPDNTMVIRGPRADVSCGHHGFSILDVFSVERTLAEALEILADKARGAADWIDVTTTLHHLFETGVLVSSSASESRFAHPFRWDNPAGHIAILDDRERTSSFLKAIGEVVTPEDIVVELGTGTGVLAVAAAKAGARHVYTIEASDIADAAQEVIVANGVSDRVTVVRGWSNTIALPERGSVLVSELIGSEALDEEILSFVRDARRRLLVPGARQIPRAVSLCAYPATVADSFYAESAFVPEKTTTWSSWYGMNLSPLCRFVRGARLLVKPTRSRAWRPLSGPLRLGTIDFASEDASFRCEVQGSASLAGRATAVIMYFELDLSPAVSLTTAPMLASAGGSWCNAVWFDPNGPQLAAGTEFSLQYHHHWPQGEMKLVLGSGDARG